MDYLIATDEAGYGPRLGPLVVTATLWRCPNGVQQANDNFERLRQGIDFDHPFLLQLSDSKKLYRPHAPEGLDRLELPLWLYLHQLLPSSVSDSSRESAAPKCLKGLLEQLAPKDLPQLAKRPWFQRLTEFEFPLSDWERTLTTEQRQTLTRELSDGPQLIGMAARLLDAPEFNHACGQAGNKATLLSETTLGLVKQLLEQLPLPATDTATDTESQNDHVRVLCDRHGGRKRYAGLIQQFFPERLPQIVSEQSHLSQYRTHIQTRQVEFQFRVGGDSFAPVALASMLAKYLRERLMQCFNTYWIERVGAHLRPTAGYAVDAARFTESIRPMADRLDIPPDQYIRER